MALLWLSGFWVTFQADAWAQLPDFDEEDEDAPEPVKPKSRKAEEKKAGKDARTGKKKGKAKEDPPAAPEPDPTPEPEPEPPPPPKPLPRIDLVIVGPGNDVFTLYGHAALLVREDPQGPIEQARVYNFGITDFKKPNYAYNFLRGQVNFWGDDKSFRAARSGWVREDRTVVRYPLNLSPEQTAQLIWRLEHDVKPEFREYRYDTFRENCATRLRDAIDEALGGAIFAQLRGVQTGRSYHDEVRRAFTADFLLLFGSEFVTGIEMERQRNAWEMMFLPEYLGFWLQRVTVSGPEGPMPLLSDPLVVHQRQGPYPLGNHPQAGQWVIGVWALLVVAGALFVRRLGRRLRGAMLLLFALPSAAWGTVLVALNLWSCWPDVRESFLLLCFMPLDLLLLWPAVTLLLGRPYRFRAMRFYLWGRLLVALAVSVLTPFVDLLHGPVAPRILAVAGLFWALCCLTNRDRAVESAPVEPSDPPRSDESDQKMPAVETLLADEAPGGVSTSEEMAEEPGAGEVIFKRAVPADAAGKMESSDE